MPTARQVMHLHNGCGNQDPLNFAAIETNVTVTIIKFYTLKMAVKLARWDGARDHYRIFNYSTIFHL